ALERQRRGIDGEPGAACLVEGVDDLPVNVELALVDGRVAGANGPRSLVSGEPVERALREVTLAGRPVHDLELRHVTRHGPEEPVAPRRGLLPEAGLEHRVQGEGRVAEP